MGVRVEIVPVRSEREDMDDAFATIAQQRADALDGSRPMRYSSPEATSLRPWRHSIACLRFTHSASSRRPAG